MYVATPSGRGPREAMSAGYLACMTTPKGNHKIPPSAVWAADNGVFGKGYPGDDEWLRWLTGRAKNREEVARCIFAVAPDVVGDAEATLAKSRPFLATIRDLGFQAAYVAQDGQESFAPPWDEFDCLFIGGSTAWKLGPHAAALVREAKARGKWVHAGRVNSGRRFAHFELLGCDSADGTYIAFGPDVNLPDVLHWSHSLFGGVTG
jgi:hypothetical protein